MSIETAYQEQLDFLYSFIDYSLTKNLRYSPEKFNLDRMHKFMNILGDPHMDYPVIHVAGTKGKGSTAILMANALLAAGKNVGFYTSPHLHDFCERIQYNLEPMPHQVFVELVDEMKPAIREVEEITTFELTTALAFLYFSKMKVEIAVIEVGLGGRLDATNVVDPIVAVITALSLDHTNVLGDTLAKIAMEKGGIIKQGKPVVIAPQKEEARLVLGKIASERNAELIRVGKDWLYAANSHSNEMQNFYVWSKEEQALVNEYIASGGREDWEPLRFSIPLLGFHQIQNAATAYGALQIVKTRGIMIKDEDIRQGFAKTIWPGRFEILNKKPPLIIDSAHNRESALRLRLAIDDYFPGKAILLVFGASEDKDIDGMLTELLPRCKYVITTKSIHPRAIDPVELKEKVLQFGVNAESTNELSDALQKALASSGSRYAIVVAGSIFVAAGMREVWFEHKREESIDETN